MFDVMEYENDVNGRSLVAATEIADDGFKVRPLNPSSVPRQGWTARSPGRERKLEINRIELVGDSAKDDEKLRARLVRKELNKLREAKRRKYDGKRVPKYIPQSGKLSPELATYQEESDDDSNSCTQNIVPQVFPGIFTPTIGVDTTAQILAGEVTTAIREFSECVTGLRGTIDDVHNTVRGNQGKVILEHQVPSLTELGNRLGDMTDLTVLVVVVVMIVVMKPKTPLERSMTFLAITGLIVSRYGLTTLLEKSGLTAWFKAPQEEVVPQAGILDSFAEEDISTLVLSFINLYVAGAVGKEILDPKKFLMVTTQLSRANPTIKTVTAGIGLVVKFISDAARSAFGEGDFTRTGYGFVDEFFKESHEVINLWSSKELYNRESSVARVKGLISFGEDVLFKLPTSGKHANIRVLALGQVVELKKILAGLLSSGYKHSGPRHEPAAILLRGSPGVFKSQAMNHLAMAVCARTLSPEDYSKFKESPIATIYNRQFESGFWDGYTGDKKVILFDDCLQCKDIAGVPDNEVMNVVRAVNIFDFILHMANLADKGNTHCRPDFVIANTNMMNIQLESIHDQRAFTRRFDIVVDVCPAKEYCINPNAGILDRKFDPSKFPVWTAEECSEDPSRIDLIGITKTNPNMCEYHLQTLTEDGMQFKAAESDPLTFNQLVDRLVEISERKKGWGRGYLADLSDTIDRERAKYEKEAGITPQSGRNQFGSVVADQHELVTQRVARLERHINSRLNDPYTELLQLYGNEHGAKSAHVVIVPLEGFMTVAPGACSYTIDCVHALEGEFYGDMYPGEVEGVTFSDAWDLFEYLKLFIDIPTSLRGDHIAIARYHTTVRAAVEDYCDEYLYLEVDFEGGDCEFDFSNFKFSNLVDLIRYISLFIWKSYRWELVLKGAVLTLSTGRGNPTYRTGISFGYGPPPAAYNGVRIGNQDMVFEPQVGRDDDDDDIVFIPRPPRESISETRELYMLDAQRDAAMQFYKLSNNAKYTLIESIIRAFLFECEVTGEIILPAEVFDACLLLPWQEILNGSNNVCLTNPAPYMKNVRDLIMKKKRNVDHVVDRSRIEQFVNAMKGTATAAQKALYELYFYTFNYTVMTGGAVADAGLAWAIKDQRIRSTIGGLAAAIGYAYASYKIARTIVTLVVGTFTGQSGERSGKVQRSSKKRRNPQVVPHSLHSDNKNLVSVIEMIAQNHLFVVQRPFDMHEREDSGRDGKIVMGYAMVVKGRCFIMPYHFQADIGTKLVDGTYNGDELIMLSYCGTGKVHYSLTVSQFVDGFVYSRSGDARDICIIRMPITYQPMRDITKHFATEKQLENYSNCDAVLFVGDKRKAKDPNAPGTPMNQVYPIQATRQSDISIQESEEWESYSIDHVFRYRANVDCGDCGSILYVDDKQKTSSIVGMHVAGNADNRIGFSAIISKEWLENYLEIAQEDYLGSDIERPLNVTLIPTRSAQADMTVVGQVVPHSMVPGRMTQTAIRKSPLHDTYFISPNYPARLAPFDLDGERVDPFDIAMSGYCPGYVCLKIEDVNHAKESLRDSLMRNSPRGVEKRVLTFREAVLGDDSGLMTSLPRSTSSGYPYTVRVKPSNKTYFFGDGPEYDLEREEAKQLEEEVMACVKLMSEGKRGTHVFTDSLKDETRKKEKVRVGNTRMFSACPIVYFILCRMYFGAFSKWIIANKIENGIAIGVNEYSSQWDQAARKLKANGIGSNIGAGDFKGLDKAEQPVFHMHIGEMVNEWYGGSEMDTKIRNILLKDLVNSFHINRGRMMYWRGSMPSGHFLTALFNSLTVHMMFRVCWKWAVEDRVQGSHDFNEMVYLLVLGDDNVFSVRPQYIPFFNEKIVAEHMIKCGQIYTSADKETELTDKLHKLCDVTFLKRRWVHDETLGRYVAPLDLDSVLDIGNWVKKGGNAYGDTENNVDIMLHELSLHSKHVFEYWSKKIKEAIDNCPGLRLPMSFSYTRYRNAVLQRDGNYWTDRYKNEQFFTLVDGEALPASDYDIVGDNSLVIKPHSGRLSGKGAGLFRLTSRMARGQSPYYPGTQTTAKGSARSKLFIGAATTIVMGESAPGKEGLFVTEQTEEQSGSDLNRNTTLSVNDAGVVVTKMNYTPLSREILNSARTGVENEIRSFLMKPKMVATGSLATTDVFSTAKVTKNIPSDLINVAGDIWQNKLQGTLAFRGTLHLTLQVNGNRFQQGRYMLVFIPTGGALNGGSSAALIRAHSATLVEATQLPRVELDVNCDTEATLIIPFLNVQGWSVVKVGATFGDIGQVNLLTYSPLVSPAGTSTCSFTLFAHYEDVEIALPTMPQSSRPRGKVRRNPTRAADQEAASGDFGPIQALANKVGVAAGVLNGIPVLSSVAAPVSWASDIIGRVAGAFGWARPRNEGPTQFISKQIMHRLTNVDAQDNSTKLAFFDRNEVEDLPNFAGSDIDEMSLNFVSGISAYYTNFNWATSAAAGTQLYSINVSPRSFASDTSQASTLITHLTPLAFVASFFSLWRGTVRFTFKIVKTEFHSGRLLACFTPMDYAALGAPPAPTIANSVYLHRSIIDIRNGNEFVVDVPYAALAQYRSTYGDDKYTGTLSLLVLNPLVAPGNVSTSVQVLVEVSGAEDFEWAGPQQPSGFPVLQWTPQSGRMSGRKDCQIVEEEIGGAYDNHSLAPARAAIGERILSFRSLLKRFCRCITYTDGPTTNQFYNFYPPQILVGQIDSAPALITPAMQSDNYDRVASCYAFLRGSMRWKAINAVRSNDPTILAMSYPRPATGFLSLDTITSVPVLTTTPTVYATSRSYAWGRGDATGGVEVEFPYYNQYPATAVADVISTGTLKSAMNGVSPFNYITTGSKYLGAFQTINSDGAAYTKPEFFRAIGEDLSLGFFVSTIAVVNWNNDYSG